MHAHHGPWYHDLLSFIFSGNFKHITVGISSLCIPSGPWYHDHEKAYMTMQYPCPSPSNSSVPFLTLKTLTLVVQFSNTQAPPCRIGLMTGAGPPGEAGGMLRIGVAVRKVGAAGIHGKLAEIHGELGTLPWFHAGLKLQRPTPRRPRPKLHHPKSPGAHDGSSIPEQTAAQQDESTAASRAVEMTLALRQEALADTGACVLRGSETPSSMHPPRQLMRALLLRWTDATLL